VVFFRALALYRDVVTGCTHYASTAMVDSHGL